MWSSFSRLRGKNRSVRQGFRRKSGVLVGKHPERRMEAAAPWLASADGGEDGITVAIGLIGAGLMRRTIP